MEVDNGRVLGAERLSVELMLSDLARETGEDGSLGPGDSFAIDRGDDFIVGDVAAKVQRLRAAGLTFRNDIISGPGGQQILPATA